MNRRKQKIRMQTEKKKTNKKKKRLWVNPISTGLIAGAAMLVILLLIDMVGYSFGLKFLKFFSLAAITGVGLYYYKQQMQDKRLFFKKGMVYGLTTVFVASLVLLAGHFLTLPMADISIATFSASLDPADNHTVGNLALVPIMTSAMLFFESLILGTLVVMALLVSMKEYGRTP
jgi:hypothetical protein